MANCTKQDIKIITTNAFGGVSRAWLEKKATEYPLANVIVEVIEGSVQDLEEFLITSVQSSSTEYDGFFFPSMLTGALVKEDALWDLTDYVRNSDFVEWPDFLRFYREELAVYDNVVRVMPLDGDLLLMYYRKDLFKEHNIQVPRTWDEYTEAAAYFHGKPWGPNGSKLVGSCVGRTSCVDVNAFWSTLVLSSMTQTQGTRSGALFNPQNMDPLLGGEAFPETLRHLVNQVRYGSQDEFDSCINLNRNEFMNENCAITYGWGDIYTASFPDAEKEAFTGISRTPGSQVVMNRETGLLEKCDKEKCPYSIEYEDIGRVNYAPYAAFGGWASAVSNFVDDKNKKAAADFFSWVASPAQSLDDVIPPPGNQFSQPYRRSHMNSDAWLAKNYTVEFVDALKSSLSVLESDSINTVIEGRYPEAANFRKAIHDNVIEYLNATKYNQSLVSYADRVQVTENLRYDLLNIINKYDAANEVPLLELYQRSLGVFKEPPSRNIVGDTVRYGSIVLAGAIIITSIAFAIFTWVKRANRVIRASQPSVLLMVCFGTALMALTIIPLSVDDSQFSPEELNYACMVSPWVYSLGFVFFYSALFSKTWRNKQIFDNPDMFTRLKVPGIDIAKTFSIMFSVTVLILLGWTTVSPLRWVREEVEMEDAQLANQLPDTIGYCVGENSWYYLFAFALAGFHILAVLFALIVAYKCRFISLEYSESTWMSISFLSYLQLWAIGLPIMVIVAKDPTVNFTMRTLIIVISSASGLFFIFVPKFKYMMDFKNNKKGSNTPSGSFVSHQGSLTLGDMGVNSTTIATEVNTAAGSQDPSRRHTTRTSIRSSTSSSRSSFYGGIKVLAHPRKVEGEATKRLRTRLDVLQIGIDDIRAQIEEIKNPDFNAADNNFIERERIVVFREGHISLRSLQ